MSEGIDTAKLAAALVSSVIDRLGRDAVFYAGIQIDKIKAFLRTGVTKIVATQLKTTSSVKTIVSGEVPIPFESIYINADFDLKSNIIRDDDIISSDQLSKRSVIYGTAGTGKSMCLRYLTRMIAKSDLGLIPIFVELRKSDENPESSFHNFLHNYLRASYDDFSATQFDALLRTGIMIFLLDGLDEVSPGRRAKFESQLLSFCRRYEKTKVVVSTRPDDRVFSWNEFNILRLRPLSHAKAKMLIRKIDYEHEIREAFISHLEESLFDTHRSFTENPLLLLMMLITYGHTHISDKMHIFYGQAFEVLFNKHDKTKGEFKRSRYCSLDIDSFERVFSVVAAASYANGILEFHETALISLIRKAFQFCELNDDPNDYLSDLIESVCLIVRDGIYLTFSHRSFQEYFAALFIKNETFVRRYEYLQRAVSRFEQDSVISLLFEMNRSILERYWLFIVRDEIQEAVSYFGPMPHYLFNHLYSSIRIDSVRGTIAFDSNRSTDLGPAIAAALHLYREIPLARNRDYPNFRELGIDRQIVEEFVVSLQGDLKLPQEGKFKTSVHVDASGATILSCGNGTDDLLQKLRLFECLLDDVRRFVELCSQIEKTRDSLPDFLDGDIIFGHESTEGDGGRDEDGVA